MAAPMHFPTATAEAFPVELGRFVDQTVGVAQAEQLFDLLCAFALNFDCPWIAYDYLTPDQRFLTPVRRNQRVILNYPDKWQERYFEMGYDKIDPIIKASRTRTGAFRWSDVYRDACTSEDERRVFDEAAKFGLRSGISIAMHGPNGSFAIMSFARDREFQNRTVTYLQLAAFHFHLKATRLENSSDVEETPDLSTREKECILWTARGKSSWEIGTILGISVNTANFHIKNAMQKLDTSSRTVAAIKALQFGIISL
ncbi:LuxR family transcriptional regulator [Sinorhizobium prairiense]|uniref:LuxR family transcriptional regulator n=1 Tax=unclassified Sinorhizobium TaxID=2613772 RepID=UPI0023D8AF26|nr:MULTISPECIES: LuxR family transcriptional regulator [unclassified Sinorhizobium]WEJ08576.1 LuxR family transcriptional regulator [Sinorhizobium sp. M103]WEJ13921.1 LuxR family transcriptional regulator [Sinorhizobium sp. K101]WEJ35522.1 LuxR family transcriptional regulator [Sinorhizobium sp. C101]